MGWVSDLSVMRSMERAWQTVIASWCAGFLPLHVMVSSVALHDAAYLVRTACAFGAGLAQSADTKKPRRSFERRGEVG